MNVIVGGGVTGIAALNTLKVNFDLYEASSKLGGVLKDHYLSSDNIFFSTRLPELW